ncbi:hypothetical protein EDD15DRAFT_2375238 [Pisolithus albus]|nr:hypothetical protein EDD15DRAFT_2375238 [Pisolithus albus]
MSTNKPKTPLGSRSLVAHGTPFSLLRLASIPAALRRKTDWSRVAMDPMVDSDTAETHWELSKDDSQTLLARLFPDKVIFGPISMGELFIKNQRNYYLMEQVFKNLVDKGLYNERERRWPGAPDLSATAATAREGPLADFFNSVIDCISDACRTGRPTRRWTADSSTRPLKGGDAVRKPDMSCWLAPGSEFDWRHLAAFAEVKNRGGKANEKSSYIETAGKASCLLYAQDGRHVALCFRILGSSIHLTIFDRGGSLSTCGYDINSEPRDFVRILIGVTSAPHEILGFDTSIAWEQQQRNWQDSWIEGVPTLVHEQQVKAPCLSAVANPPANHSTHFLRAGLSQFKTSPYYLRVLSRIITQPVGDLITDFSCLGELLVAFLDYVVAHKNAVEVAHILHRDISLFNLFLADVTRRNDHKESMEMAGLPEEAWVELCERIAKLRRRGILGDWGYAVPMAEHTATRSDAAQFSDATDPPTSPIEVSSQTTDEPVNCVYVVPVSSESAEPRLISVADLTGDHNIVLSMGPQSETKGDSRETIDMSPLHRTGTWSWMSAELVMAGPGQSVVHDPLHDLESLFYVLVGIYVLLDGPSKPKCDKELAQCFDKYFNTFEPSMLKTITIQSDITWRPFILHHISEYFQPAVDLLTRLHDALIVPLFFDDHGNIRRRQPFTHDMFIANIIDTLSHLGPDVWVPVGQENNDNSDYSSSGVKVEDEPTQSGVAKEVIIPPPVSTDESGFSPPSLMPLPPMLRRPTPHRLAAGPGFYSLDSGLALRDTAAEDLDRALPQKRRRSSSRGEFSTHPVPSSSSRGTQSNPVLRGRRGHSTGSILQRGAHNMGRK